MTLFMLRKEDGLYYPVILSASSSAPICDDATGGYLSKGEAMTSVRQAYGNDARCLSQRAFTDEVERRRAAHENRFHVADYPPIECPWTERMSWGL